MKILVTDPQLDQFGHHVDFNAHVLRLLGAAFSDVVFLDVEHIVERNGPFPNVEYVSLGDELLGGDGETELTVDEFQAAQNDNRAIARLWETVDSISPDVVVCTSEGTKRGSWYRGMPSDRPYRIFVITHVIWSMLRTLRSPEVLAAVKRAVSGLLVVEPFLVNSYRSLGLPTYWFPHRSYSPSETQALMARKKPVSCVPTIGTAGVIGERRNHAFIIDALGRISNRRFDYVVAGELKPAVRNEVMESIEKFRERSNNGLFTKFGYLDRKEFDDQIKKLDCGLLAYDATRNLQASGVVYKYAEAGVPLLAPNTELFRNYRLLYPGLFKLYEPADSDRLITTINEVLEPGDRDSFDEKRFRDSRCSFFEINRLSYHVNYVKRLFQSAYFDTSEFVLGNAARRESSTGLAVTYYHIAKSRAPGFTQSAPNLAKQYRLLGDESAAEIWRRRSPRAVKSGNDVGPLCMRTAQAYSILVYPGFGNWQEASGFLLRLAWHLFPIHEKVRDIYVILSVEPEPEWDRPDGIDEVTSDLIKYFSSAFRFISKDQVHEIPVDSIDFSFVWHYSDKESRKMPFSDDMHQLSGRPVWRVDEERERFSTSFLLKSVSSLLDERWMRERSKEIFKEVAQRFRNRICAVFGTGPSLSKAFYESFVGVDTIASNSMVKNIELLDHLRPRLIVCADPIFHAGPSTYAETFRKQLGFALKRYKCPLVVPERDFHIYAKYFSGSNIEIIAVPFRMCEIPNYRMLANFHVTTTGNILTLFLLQIAYSVSDEVHIYGCDGRPKTANEYFWGHDSSSQFHDHMSDIQRVHPGFFNMSYDDYYDEHCRTLEQWLAYAESVGKVAKSRTFSYIDALAAREYRLLE